VKSIVFCGNIQSQNIEGSCIPHSLSMELNQET
jgi:hypothetical protein